MATATAAAILDNPDRQAEDAIRAVIAAIERAHHDKDAAAIVAPYARDAVLYTLAPPLAHDPDREQTQAWLATWDGPIERTSRDVAVDVHGDLAVCRGYFHLAGTPRMAGQAIGFWMRGTVVLHRRGSAWQIVHEHMSVPFYMDESLRPAFDLVP